MKWKKQKESKSNSLPHDINMVPSLGISLKIIISFTVISASAIPITESTPSTRPAIPVTESTPSTRRAILKDPDDDEEKDALLQAYLAPETCQPSHSVQTCAIPEDIQLSREGEGISYLSREGEGISYLIMKFRMNCKSETSPIPFAIKFQKYWWKMSVLLVQKLPPFLPCPPGDHQGIEQRQKVT